MRIAQRGGDVEPELVAELDDAVAQLDAHHSAACNGPSPRRMMSVNAT